ncbi:BioC: malonyl-acyl carrier protein O-methyltransferase BioC [Tepidimonas sediminis]|uniref:BioC: malonyl-acyl carrier protein O-methyltransferase BioC n=1 Tax=Tepidimonas sediminis TaxID=2588941 RepID=A0A554WRD8_9BURK|nr:biotin synthase [Tepidimonas sediminis]TSE26133.1 BioC: malonyl-acyl carrier protein O-methyltransferase BioC [Tepidimonas sediminis]
MDTPAAATPPGLDPVAAARWLRRVPPVSPWLHEWVGERMAARLDWIRRTPRAWLSWAPRLGGEQAHRLVAQRYGAARVWLGGPGAAASMPPASAARRRWWPWGRAAEPAPVTVPQLAADGVVAEPVELVWANMVLHAAPQPRALLRHWLDWLAVDGFLMLSCLGPDTARELRALHAAHGWPPPAADYVDMHDWGDLLVELGYAEPVMDMERLTLTYADARRLLEDLRAWGRNWHPGRHPALRGRRWHVTWLAAVERELPRDAQGRLCLTVEVVYGHAFKPAPRAPSGEVTVPLQRLREQLRQRAAG